MKAATLGPGCGSGEEQFQLEPWRQLRELVTLAKFAAEIFDLSELFVGLCAFGYDFRSEGTGEAERNGDQGGAFGDIPEAVYEGAVHLRLVVGLGLLPSAGGVHIRDLGRRGVLVCGLFEDLVASLTVLLGPVHRLVRTLQ